MLEEVTGHSIGRGAKTTVFLLLLFDFLWRNRYRATRRPLIRKSHHAAVGSSS